MRFLVLALLLAGLAGAAWLFFGMAAPVEDGTGASSGARRGAPSGAEEDVAATAPHPVWRDEPLESDRDVGGGEGVVERAHAVLDDAPEDLAQYYLEARYTDDLDDLIRRGVIRILVTYDRTNFFVVDGQPRGFEYELLEEYWKYLKTRVRSRSWPVTFFFIPVPFNELLPGLVAGRGDIAAAGLTVTPERQEIVAFTEPYIADVKEVVVTHRSVTGLETLDDLAGRRVYVDPRTSFAEHLRDLSAAFEARGLAPVEIVDADPKLLTEDILDLVNAGAVGITVADDHVARVWAEVLPDIVVRDDLAIHGGGRIAWAVRRDNPELLGSLNAAIEQIARGTLVGNVIFERYYEGRDWIGNPLDREILGRLNRLREVFERYAGMYGFDWRALAAVAYQESRLDPTVRSPAGAVGLMQVRPETADDPNIAVADVASIEGNVHAGAKYLAFLRDTYFTDPGIAPEDRIDFVLAAYNAGPGRIGELREKAEREGLDPTKWSANVARVARRDIGRETVEYVANVNKYYVAYRLADNVVVARGAAIETLKEGGGAAGGAGGGEAE